MVQQYTINFSVWIGRCYVWGSSWLAMFESFGKWASLKVLKWNFYSCTRRYLICWLPWYRYFTLYCGDLCFINSLCRNLTYFLFLNKRATWHCMSVIWWSIYLYWWISLSLVTCAPGAEGSINIISTARVDWAPSQPPSDEGDDHMLGVNIRTKGSRDADLMDLGRPSQADWIRQYMKQQEEVQDSFYYIFLEMVTLNIV